MGNGFHGIRLAIVLGGIGNIRTVLTESHDCLRSSCLGNSAETQTEPIDRHRGVGEPQCRLGHDNPEYNYG